MNNVMERVTQHGVVPVVVVDNPADAVPLAHTLVEAGLPVIELTLRTPAALQAMAQIAAQVPQILLGAGTVLTTGMLDQAIAAGAKFGVSPGLSPVAKAAVERGLPFIPGAVTPSEVIGALDLGLTHIKFFPAGAYGGLKTLTALGGPFQATGAKFMPTGGVKAETAGEYLASDLVFAVGGTWIAPLADINAHNWDAIGQRAAQAAAIGRPGT
ncbi:MAG: bifunctional 4-hydroxy-2-oxoglutarate aldolase/2-dehydro-3-deoxy-phosphogluconate aldolase [Bifidobacteriaceae bacterium]|jgi:2-dehydro-3-deoxyphosphogluconate aldolase/(4S)-4-hydroxy-2-oxoglutarate aldolase|nr:bifunctional 4-hydroxy-2-oxoglutarate aldolase/2-dehydro-3-deoxy-phosphogluconate aldolase [Bifidobacteriaceae bacterium]